MEAGLERRTWEGLEGLRPFLRRCLARRCRNDAEVEDVVQETCLRAARYRGSLDDGRSLRPWALRIAFNVLADRAGRPWSARRSDLAYEGGIEEIACADLGPAAREEADPEYRVGNWLFDKGEALRHLRGALGGLREEDRELLRAHYAGAGSCRETAHAFDLPVDLVKVRLYRARRRLLRAMRRRMTRGGRLWVDGSGRVRDVGEALEESA